MSDPGYTAETAPAAFRDAYKVLEPDPNADYGTLLPLARDRATGEKRWAMPSMVRDLLGGWLDLLAGVDTGEVTPRAAMQVGLGGLGAGGALAPRGALAIGGARNDLAWDFASRMARARGMGFNVDTPVFHGTNKVITPGFSLTPDARATNARSALEAIWAAENPEVAGAHADLAAFAARRPGQNILPLLFRADSPKPLRLEGNERDYEIANTIWDAFHNRGIDAIKFENYPNIATGRLGENVWAFKNPNQLRSRFALFDPERRDSSDLMAGFAVPGPAPTPGFHVSPPGGPAPTPGFRVSPANDAPGLDAFRRMRDEGRVS